MNREIHELINMKARRIELEVELGTSDLTNWQLSNLQRQHIQEDLRRQVNSQILMEMVNETIEADESIILSRH